MSPDRHGDFLAAISHVPHLASSLIAKLAPQDALQFVGGGWRDITRVAAGDPPMWTAICQHNRTAIVHHLDELIRNANNLKATLTNHDDDALLAWLTDAKNARDSADPQT